ncbi:MAG TPA: hypothetical protein VFX43_19070 [Chitinophagaceae bacterium]|jgi:hypothetical protein|nr:hypothetical protein [Chitinophagaceae bacterium]
MQYPELNHFFTAGDAFHITVTRKSQLMESHEPMQIIINGYQAGLLKNGETATYPIYGEQAQLQAYLAMNKTPVVHISAAEASEKSFLVESSMTNTLFITGTILVIISAILVLRTEQLLYMLIAAPPALYHVYMRFIKKDKYLLIREMEIADVKLS